MSQLGFKLRKSFGQPVRLVVFLSPLAESGKFERITKRFVSFKQGELQLDSNHKYPLKLSDWCEQIGNMIVQYRDYEDAYKVYSINEVSVWLKPNSAVAVSAKEFASNKVAEMAKSIVSGASLNAGMILLIITLVAGLMGGALLGYLGFPLLMGQHLVPNTPSPAV